MDINNYPEVGYSGARRLIANAARTKRPVILMGKPGTGKTALVGAIARDLGVPALWFDIGNRAREDAIMPALVDDGRGGKLVVTFPLDAIRAACDGAGCLVFDELTRADRNKQALFMALSNERRIGSFTLHPGTVVVAMGNDTESAGTYGLNDALINRCCVVRLVPQRDEVRAMLATIGAEGTTLNKLMVKLSAISGIRTELLAINPPEGAQESGAQWPSPRALHHCMEALASWLDSGEPMDEVALAMAGGIIGREAAAALFAVLANEGKLPSAEEIIASPKTTKLPPDIESAVAALGLVKLVQKKSPEAAWFYTDRFASAFPEVQASLVRDLMGKPPVRDAEAMKIFDRLVGKTNLTAARAR